MRNKEHLFEVEVNVRGLSVHFLHLSFVVILSLCLWGDEEQMVWGFCCGLWRPIDVSVCQLPMIVDVVFAVHNLSLLAK